MRRTRAASGYRWRRCTGFWSRGGRSRETERYTILSTIGQGGYGVIAKCRSHATGEELAVKLVSQGRVPRDAAVQEVQILRGLDHRNIIMVRDFFHEMSFVCIVMDLFRGGSLLEGMLRHFRKHGLIAHHQVMHAVQQIAESIRYLHSRGVVHRDVKETNFLMDCSDISSPRCHIVLADFGAATRVTPDQRLTAAVGTNLYWSPEFYDRLYGAKVDVWAMGVIVHSLVTAGLPFHTEEEVRTKDVQIPEHVHPVCKRLIVRMLAKDETRRPSSDAIFSQAWTAPVSAERPLSGENKGDGSSQGMCETFQMTTGASLLAI